MSHVVLRRLGALVAATALVLTVAPVAGSGGVAVAAVPAVQRSAVVTPTATPVASSVGALRGYRTLSHRGYRRPFGHGFGRGFFLWWILRSALRGGIGLFILLALVALFAFSALQRRGGASRRW